MSMKKEAIMDELKIKEAKKESDNISSIKDLIDAYDHLIVQAAEHNILSRHMNY